MSQFPNIVIEDLCWRVNGGVGTGAVGCGGADTDIGEAVAGAVVGVAVATGGGWMYTYFVVSVPADG